MKDRYPMKIGRLTIAFWPNPKEWNVYFDNDSGFFQWEFGFGPFEVAYSYKGKS